MTRIIIRHGLSEANNRENWGTPAFGHPDARLMERGRIDAAHLGPILEQDYRISPAETDAAASRLYRTGETAQIAGHQTIRLYPLLDEIEGLSFAEKKKIKDTGILPALVLRESEKTLNNFPEEKVIYSHALRIAGICKLLGVYQEPVILRPYPRFCEIRELPL